MDVRRRGGGRSVTPSIRRAGPDDAAVLAEIGAALFTQTYAGDVPEDEMQEHLEQDFGLEQQRAELTDPAMVSFLVESGGKALGFAQVRRRPLPIDSDAPASVELWRIYLDASLHGLGIARELLREVGVAARELGADGIWLAVWERNPRALAFYEKHGFTRAGRQDFHVGGEVHCDAVLRAPPDAF